MRFCDRPHENTIDFGASRFVVGKGCGIDVDGQHLELGDPVPEGLGMDVLRRMYEPPLRLIEVVEYAMKVPELREACARRQGEPAAVSAPAAQTPEPKTPAPDAHPPKQPKYSTDYLDGLSASELQNLCRKHKLATSYVNKAQLRDRLRTVVV
jgi:hypothetical protein